MMMMDLRLILALFACFLNVWGAPKPRVTEVNRTLSCCEQVKIHATKGCVHTFTIGSMTVARVTDTEDSVMEPVQFLPDERMMLVQECMDFTHEISCDISPSRASLEIIHYHPTCSREDSPPDAANTVQGSVLFLLLTMALKMIYWHHHCAA